MIKNLWTRRRKILESNKKENKKIIEKPKTNPPRQYQEKRELLSDPGPEREKCGYLRNRDRCKSLGKCC